MFTKARNPPPLGDQRTDRQFFWNRKLWRQAHGARPPFRLFSSQPCDSCFLYPIFCESCHIWLSRSMSGPAGRSGCVLEFVVSQLPRLDHGRALDKLRCARLVVVKYCLEFLPSFRGRGALLSSRAAVIRFRLISDIFPQETC